ITRTFISRINKKSSMSERASCIFSETEDSEILSSADRSAPEQKSLPEPVITTALVRSSPSAARKASLIPAITSSLSAFLFSGRFSVILFMLPSLVDKTTLFSTGIRPPHWPVVTVRFRISLTNPFPHQLNQPGDILVLRQASQFSKQVQNA